METTLAGKGGVPLHVRWWVPESAPRGVFQIVHGLKSHGGRYDGLAAELVQRGWAVVAHDHRGHGKSGGPRVDVESFEDFLDDLELVHQTARERFPGAKVVLFGHSMGGQLAVRFALDRKPLLSGVAIAAPALGVPKALFTRLQAAGARALHRYGRKIGWPRTDKLRVFELNVRDFSRDPEVVASMRADPLIFGNGTAGLAAELLESIAKTQSRASELKVPLLAMHGGADRVTDAGDTEGFVRQVGRPDAAFIRFPEHVHDLLHDRDAATARQALYEGLERWLARS